MKNEDGRGVLAVAVVVCDLEPVNQGRMNYGQAIQDESTNLGAAYLAQKSEREAVISAWIAKGFSREQAYRKALGK